MSDSPSAQQQELVGLMRELLRENYVHLRVNRVTIEENLERETTSVSCEVTEEASGERFVIAGRGVGIIDAFFQGMVERFAAEYPSLDTICISAFSVRARVDTKRKSSGADSEGEVLLEIRNSEGQPFHFAHSSRSVIASGIITTLAGMEYFINSERAFVTVYHAMKDAERRNRADLVERYVGHMAVLVRNTSYSEVIGKLRAEMA
jgi:hypothetical protein